MSIIVVYFTLQYPQNGAIGKNNIQKWWGNTVSTNTADFGPQGAGTPLSAMPPGQTFGYVKSYRRVVLGGQYS